MNAPFTTFWSIIAALKCVEHRNSSTYFVLISSLDHDENSQVGGWFIIKLQLALYTLAENG